MTFLYPGIVMPLFDFITLKTHCMNKKNYLILIGLFFTCWLKAQSVSSSVISPNGDISQGKNISLEWTLGELNVDYLTKASIKLSEGFHQPILDVAPLPKDWIDSPSTAKKQDLLNNYQIEAWPSPVHDLLNIDIQSESDELISVELMDVMGRKVISKTTHSSSDLIKMDFSDKTPGLYLLRFLKNDGTLLKTILNVKH